MEPVIDAWFDSGSMPAAQVGYPHVAGSAEAHAVPGAVHRRGDRPDARMVLLPARGEHLGLWRHAVRARALSRAHRRRERQEDEQVTSATSSTRGRCSTPAAPTPCAGGCSPRDRRGRRRARASGAIDASHARDAGDALEHLQLLHDVRLAQQLRPARSRDSRRPRIAARSTSGSSRALERVTEAVTRALDGYEPLGGTDALVELVDDLSNWYVRRSRRRFWRTDPNAPRSDSLAAQATLLEVLQRVTFLLAPFCPLLTERLYQELFDVSDFDSVHLVDWPRADPERRNEALEDVDGRGAAPHLARSSGPRRGRRQGSPAPGASVGVPAGELADAAGGRRRGRAQRRSPGVRDASSPTCCPSSWCRTSAPSGPRLGEAVKELKPALARARLRRGAPRRSSRAESSRVTLVDRGRSN